MDIHGPHVHAGAAQGRRRDTIQRVLHAMAQARSVLPSSVNGVMQHGGRKMHMLVSNRRAGRRSHRKHAVHTSVTFRVDGGNDARERSESQMSFVFKYVHVEIEPLELFMHSLHDGNQLFSFPVQGRCCCPKCSQRSRSFAYGVLLAVGIQPWRLLVGAS